MPKVETFNRQLVLEQAMEVFHDKGYNATSMQDLVDATGLNRSSIYNTFKSKLDLYLECLHTYQSVYRRRTNEVLANDNDALQHIQDVFQMYLADMMRLDDKKGCMITNCKSEMAHHQSSITAFLEMNQQQSLEFFEDLVRKGQKEGSINTRQSESDYALYLYSNLQGFRMTGILTENKPSLNGIIDTILQTLK